MNYLTIREQQVLEVFSKGLRRNKILARELGITERVVKHHLTNIFRKYQVTNRYDLMKVVRDE
jgi:DNA-binding NarL/FixJ family response regulator